MSALEIENRLEYFYCCIGAFAFRHSLTNAEAYRYLSNFKGLDFIDKHYGAEHSQSIEDSVEDMTAVCKRNGGRLS